MFAKIFDLPKYGQVLVMLDEDEEGAPVLNWFAEPDGFGVCKFGMGYSDDDEGFEKALAVFECADDAMAEKVAGSIFGRIGAQLKEQA